ncbi:MAG: SbcC/MukB-like Walker B domain-containing protein, partial [Streptosporangiaceae bacterium]
SPHRNRVAWSVASARAGRCSLGSSSPGSQPSVCSDWARTQALLGALVYARLPGAAGPRLDRAQGALFVGGLHNALRVCGLALLAAAALAALLFSLPDPGNPGETDSQADEVPGGARRIGDRHPELPHAGQRPPTAGFLTHTAQAPARRAADADDRSLSAWIRHRVEEFHSADPSSGYAAHLAAALYYRQWHEVNVTILGPEEGQQRRLSRRAKLSQGETRFVSYVTLFAAADGYLTSLGDDDRALRLILLDDAFAKVDEGTVAELMGLLVTLDLDFVMTGHALWGCFPQVPRLDVYEVRRSGGSSAVTTHVHWDGHSRHLRSTTRAASRPGCGPICPPRPWSGCGRCRGTGSSSPGTRFADRSRSSWTTTARTGSAACSPAQCARGLTR